jgi:hypothetical protein
MTSVISITAPPLGHRRQAGRAGPVSRPAGAGGRTPHGRVPGNDRVLAAQHGPTDSKPTGIRQPARLDSASSGSKLIFATEAAICDLGLPLREWPDREPDALVMGGAGAPAKYPASTRIATRHPPPAARPAPAPAVIGARSQARCQHYLGLRQAGHVRAAHSMTLVVIRHAAFLAAARAGRIGDGFYPAVAPDRLAELLRIVRRSAQEAGRDPAMIEITAGAGQHRDADTVKRYQDLGVTRVMVGLPTQDPVGCQKSAWPPSCGDAPASTSAVGDDDRLCPFVFCISSLSGSAAGLSCLAARQSPGRLSCWCCGMRSRCCAVPVRSPAWTGPTARSSLR